MASMALDDELLQRCREWKYVTLQTNRPAECERLTGQPSACKAVAYGDRVQVSYPLSRSKPSQPASNPSMKFTYQGGQVELRVVGMRQPLLVPREDGRAPRLVVALIGAAEVGLVCGETESVC